MIPDRVAIRAYASSETGIGHLMRMRHLAAALQQQGAAVIFMLDHPDTGLRELLDGLEVLYLRQSASLQLLDQQQDALQVVEQLLGSSVEVVLVDDYRLDAIWEAEVKRAGYRVVSIDDTATRMHQCDLLVDQKWRGEKTVGSYQGLVPRNCQQLLGPDYTLLAAEYGKLQQKVESHTEAPFKVLLSLGGGGDLAMLASLVEVLVEQYGYDAEHIQLQVVVGPASKNCKRLLELAEQGVVQLLVGKRSLFEYYRSASLIVGAAGGSIYEWAALKVPSISFSISDNQQNNQSWLDDIGHYFHLPELNVEDTYQLAQLIESVRENYDRIRQLFLHAPIQLDGKGCIRVASEVCRLLSDDNVCIAPPAPMNGVIKREEVEGYLMRKVDDRDMNHYLQSRNLKLNRGNMIEQDKIRPVDHYCWWLVNQRDSFLLFKNGDPMLYIWHECVEVLGEQYWIGGWFVCGDACQYQDTLYALSWQLEWTDKYYPEIPWIAVISRENNFVKLLNQYQGFNEVKVGSERSAVIAAAFPKASFEQFYFVTREPRCESS